MGPFGIPWPIAIVYILGFIGVPVAIEILLHSKWWKALSDHYFSFNNQAEEENKQEDTKSGEEHP